MPIPAVAAPLLAPIMAALVNGLRWLFMSRAGLFIASALAWLGINLGTVNLVLEPTIQLLSDYTTGTAGGGGELFDTAKQWAGVLNFDKAVTMIISAYITKHALMKGRLMLFKRGVGAG